MHSVTALVFFPALAGMGGFAVAGENDWRYSLAVAPASILEADLDDGGKTRLNSYHLRVGADRTVNPDLSVGIKAQFEAYDRDFSGSTGFAALRPWSETSRLGVATMIRKRTQYGWSYGIRPYVSWASESGELDSDALSYGVGFAVVGGLSPERRAGLGARFSREIDDSFRVAPVLIVDWQFNERWGLGNPHEPNFTVPAGLEIRYRHDDYWQFALAGVYQSSEFRLDESTFAPKGIGESSGFLSYLRVTRLWGPQLSVSGYLGAMFNGELQVDDADGNEIASTRFGTAPLAALALEGSF